MEAAATQQPKFEAQSEKLYRFDEAEIYSRINVRPEATKPAYVTYKFRKPNLEELTEWAKSAVYQSTEINKRENESRYDDIAANVKLFNKIVLAVRGEWQSATDFRPLTDEQKERVKIDHKVAAVDGLYSSTCEIDYGDEEQEEEQELELMIFGGQQWTVRQRIGGDKYTIVHILREPAEAERVRFKRTSTNTTYLTGARKQQQTTRTNLKSYVELYDAVIVDVQGGTVDGYEMNDSRAIERAKFIQQIDPVFKQLVIRKLMAAIEAEYQD
jgi:hypothetical protein